MSEYRCLVTINADADDVFGFVSDPDNLSLYLPTVRSAEVLSEDEMRLNVERAGTLDEELVSLDFDEDSRRMEWGLDGSHPYQGWLQVTGDARSCQVTVRLQFPQPTHSQDREDEINMRLREVLKTIKILCEGGGARVANYGIAYADNPS